LKTGEILPTALVVGLVVVVATALVVIMGAVVTIALVVDDTATVVSVGAAIVVGTTVVAATVVVAGAVLALVGGAGVTVDRANVTAGVKVGSWLTFVVAAACPPVAATVVGVSDVELTGSVGVKFASQAASINVKSIKTRAIPNIVEIWPKTRRDFI